MATAYAPQPEDSPDSGAMSDEELAGHLSEHERRAIGYYESEIASEQADALDRYYRRPYGDERTGRSQVVDGTVAITVDNALAAVLKPFVSSDETVVFSPTGPEDEEIAEQATEYVNYVLHNDNCGFLILHDWVKDGLLQKVGVVKAYWEDYSKNVVERVENLDPVQVQQLQQSGEAIAVYGPDENGLYTADIQRRHEDGKLCIVNIPPEEYRISPFARPGQTPPYEAHVTRKMKSELIEMGFDRDVVKSLSKGSNTGIDDSRAIARYEDEQWGTNREDTVGTEANDLVDFNDEFVLIDYDGDGVSELRRVMRSGNVILYNEAVDYSLFARFCPAPMPHKIYGMSLADQVKDEQKISTVLWRQTLDNVYLSNNPRPVVEAAAERPNGVTIDDLLVEAPGAIIRTGAGNIESFGVPFVADKAFPMLAYVEKQAESRTGISKQGQGMDPDALSTAGQITATQSAIEEEGRNSRGEMIARIFAETGLRDLFRLMLKILVNHQPRERMVRLRSKWVPMDPRSWNADMDVSISVGLGIGSKAQQIMTAQTVLTTMEALGASPYAQALIDSEKVYNGVKRLFNAAGIKNVDDFLKEPQRDEQGNVVEPPQQPDPKTQAAMAQVQIAQMRAQSQSQLDQMKLEQQGQVAYMNAQLEAQKASHKAALDQQSAQFEAGLAQQKFAFEARLAALEAAHNEHMDHRNAERQDRIAESTIHKNRSGGDLSK